MTRRTPSGDGLCADRDRSSLADSRHAPTFPPGFLWGTAISGFQTEAGGVPANGDTGSDWWVWAHDPTNIAQRLRQRRPARRTARASTTATRAT